MALADQTMRAAIAATRFGLGARPGEIALTRRDPQGFLRSQIRREGADLPPGTPATSAQRLNEFRDYQRDRRAAKVEKTVDAPPQGVATMAARDPVNLAGRMLRQDLAADFSGRIALAATTDAAFRERWALFWANHFTVSASKAITATVVGPFEDEAIRPHVFGRFEDLLAAAETHPAMLTYLDQVQSIGPDSPAALFLKTGGPRGVGARPQPATQRTVGLNENLAREILELHTVGVSAGYTQADVTEFARAMTGLSIGGPRDESYGAPLFRAQAHEPGERTVMGVRYAPGGRAQASAILSDLAARPQTARFICGKIARHFVADDPPPALVGRLDAAWTSSRGDLARVAEALIAAPEAWEPKAAKFKTPYEFIVSSYRAADASPMAFDRLAPILTGLGQKPFSAPSPKGWPDDAQSWAAADAIVKRMQFAQGFSGAALRDRDPRTLAVEALGERLSAETAKAIARAESRAEGFALLLMSPEFQRR
ncbi:DUF1800 family protein [Phenylobacterium sp.]|uniref:DUF1800 domain-containing protein n=1 Tax=Phenylobacterium sp. TaxID=1871053 RepID=UPI00286A1FF3|nr:DUF1800 family protein [Phenylobacterium sp.]